MFFTFFSACLAWSPKESLTIVPVISRPVCPAVIKRVPFIVAWTKPDGFQTFSGLIRFIFNSSMFNIYLFPHKSAPANSWLILPPMLIWISPPSARYPTPGHANDLFEKKAKEIIAVGRNHYDGGVSPSDCSCDDYDLSIHGNRPGLGSHDRTLKYNFHPFAK